MAYPFVTIIMPIRNEADFIERSLGAVLNQDYPHEQLEVIIADGLSDDDTRPIVRKLASEIDIEVKIVDNPGRIVPTGFNTALDVAKGDIIVRVDGHTIIDEDYVSQCVSLLTAQRADNVGGRMNAVGQGIFGKAVAIATSSPFGVGGARFHYSQQEEFVDTVYMGAWWRHTFDEIGYFDEQLVRNQDDEFNYRLRSHGGKILLSPNIKSTYFNRSTLKGLAKQYFQYGVYKVRVMQKHPQQMRPRQFAPFALVATLLTLGVAAPFNALIRMLWLFVLFLYTAANLLASLITAKQTEWKYLSKLPFIYAILHMSYGMGFIVGLAKFRNSWKSRTYGDDS